MYALAMATTFLVGVNVCDFLSLYLSLSLSISLDLSHSLSFALARFLLASPSQSRSLFRLIACFSSFAPVCSLASLVHFSNSFSLRSMSSRSFRRG